MFRSPTGATVDDLGFGEDFELLAAVREPGRFAAIGRVEAGEGVELLLDGEPYALAGWEHYQVGGERFLEVLLRAGAVHGLPRLATREQDHGRQRKHAVARRGRRVGVDVDLHDVERQLLEGRLDRLARPAPRRPEIDHDGLRSGQHLVGERRVGHLAHAAYHRDHGDAAA